MLSRLCAAGMVDCIADDEALRLHGVRCSAGMLGVTKKDSDVLRMIVDRRRSNALERSFGQAFWKWLESLSAEERARVLTLFMLPCGSQFTDLWLAAGEEFEIFYEDAKDFYYILGWPAELWASSANWPTAIGQAACLVAPAMGDAKATDLAQGVSAGIMHRAAAVMPEP